MIQRSVPCAFLIVTISLVGCGEPPSSARPTRPDVTPSESPAPVKSDETQVTKETVVQISESNWAELQSLIQTHMGKVVVVDVWSTSCEPCMKEFPHLIELQNKYPNDVVAISFDVDFIGIKNKPVSYYRERVLKFLGSQPENKVLHRMSTTAADDLFTEINLSSIPAVYVYGQDGSLAKRFDESKGEAVSYDKQITPFVSDLVKASSK